MSLRVPTAYSRRCAHSYKVIAQTGRIETPRRPKEITGSSKTFGFAREHRQLLAQREQLGSIGALGNSSSNIFSCTTHFEHSVHQLDSLGGRQDDRVRWNAGALHRITLLVRTLATRLAAVPAATADAHCRYATTAPRARTTGASGARARGHEMTLYSRFRRPRCPLGYERAGPGKMGRLRLLATREPIRCSWRCR